VLACAGVEPQYFVGNAILVRAKRRSRLLLADLLLTRSLSPSPL